MPINSVSDDNGNTIAIQIPIEEWHTLMEKYPDVEITQQHSDIPNWQKGEILKRKKYYEGNTKALLHWEDAKKRLVLQ